MVKLGVLQVNDKPQSNKSVSFGIMVQLFPFCNMTHPNIVISFYIVYVLWNFQEICTTYHSSLFLLPYSPYVFR